MQERQELWRQIMKEKYGWRHRDRQREIRDVETVEQREERLKIMRKRQIDRTAMEQRK